MVGGIEDFGMHRQDCCGSSDPCECYRTLLVGFAASARRARAIDIRLGKTLTLDLGSLRHTWRDRTLWNDQRGMQRIFILGAGASVRSATSINASVQRKCFRSN